MRTINTDVLVVGAGPAGSITAKYAAMGGANVLMIEKRPEIGVPVRCAEGIAKRWIGDVGIKLDRKWIACEVEGARIISPNGSEFCINERLAGNEVGTVLDRHIFDKTLAQDAANAGTDIMLRTAARSLIKEDGKVVGVRAEDMGEPLEIRAKLIVGADGFESQIGRWAGIDTNLDTGDIITCFQYRLTNCEPNMDYCDFYMGSAAPGGYVWIFPKDETSANVGLGIQLSKLKEPGEVKGYLDRWIARTPQYANGKPVEMIAGACSLSPPPDTVTADNILLVGDAARMIDAITGGGIANGCIAGREAGEVAALAIENGDTSKPFLQQYEKRWRAKLEDGLFRDWIAKEKLVTISDETFDKVISTLA
ncbi:MAG: NAD(P)/FAD-dependent oxidoreductase, partial [Thermoplasmata archaeon]|nr:NAD(P)/FAD-dependent oxidoreductase [Thermoplasmata archaeon]